MKRILLLCLLSASAARAQTSSYPGALDTDAGFKVAANRIETVLRGSIGASDTVVTVANSTGIAVNMLLSIDREIVNVTALGTNNQLTIARAFDGTTAASHLNGSRVTANWTAWHHNFMSSAVKAIQAALGPNLVNAGGDEGVLSTNCTTTGYMFWRGATAVVDCDGNITWDNTNKRLQINSAALYNDGGNGSPNQTSVHRFSVSEGTTLVPITNNAPTAVFSRYDGSLSPIPFQFNLQKQSGGGYTYANSTYVRVADPAAQDTVALVGRIYDDRASASVSNPTIWGLWVQATRINNATTRAAGAEIDVINFLSTDSPDPESCTANCGIGVQIVSDGYKQNSVAIDINSPNALATPPATSKWKRGLWFSHPVSQYGIDLYKLGKGDNSVGNPAYNAPIRLPNSKGIGAMNNAGTADINMLYAGADDTTRVGSNVGVWLQNEAASSVYLAAGPNGVQLLGKLFAGLGAPAAGTVLWCSDCSIATPCAGSGTGAYAFRTATQWKCPF